MAVSTETITSSTDWIQYYQQNLPGEAQTRPAEVYGGRVSDSTVVTTTFTSTSVPSPRGSSGSDHLSPDGRVSKPIRRRSRASRRTPTTLLNTDTNNFRAMVQQFTGGPNQGLPTGFHRFPSGANFSFEQGNHVQQTMINPAAAVAPNRNPFQFQQQQQQLRTNDQQQLYHQVENLQQYGVSSLNNFDAVPANAFLQRLDDSRTTSVNDHNNNTNHNNML